MSVLDFHCRLGPRPGAAERMLAAMDRCGIGRAVVCPGGVIDLDRLARNIMVGGYSTGDADNDAVLAACAASDGRLLPFFLANPHAHPARYRNRAARFRGLELSPAVHGVPLSDERNLALVEIAAEFGHSVYVVCIGRPGCGAADLVGVAGRYPEVTFVLGHCGFVGIDVWSINHIAPIGNICAETSGCYTATARIAVDRLGAERVVFGTEYPLQAAEVELAKLRALELDELRWANVMWRTAGRLLGEGMHRDAHPDHMADGRLAEDR